MQEAVKRVEQQPTEGYRPTRVPQALKVIRGVVDEAVNSEERLEMKRSPIQNRIGGTFVPVRDIEKARDWYCAILGIAEKPEIMSGHLCPLPMEGAGLILDTMPQWGGKEPSGPAVYQTPAFMFATDDLQASYEFMKEKGVELVTDIQYDHWFAFRDLDGNLLMVCR